MQAFFARNSVARHLLSLGGVSLAMSQVAAWHPLIAALCTFLLLMILMAIVALQGDPRAASLLAIVAAMLGTGVCWYDRSDTQLSAAISLIGTGSLAGLSAIVCLISRRRIDRIEELEARHRELMNKVYEYDRAAGLPEEIPDVQRTQAAQTSRRKTDRLDSPFQQILADLGDTTTNSACDPNVVDFAVLLLSMQKIGHRLTAELELDSLVSAILSTSRELLKCQTVELYLWNPEKQRLVNADPRCQPAVNSLQEVLQQSESQPAVFDWVLQQQRLLTRREVLAGKIRSATFTAEQMPTAIAPLMVGQNLIGLLVIDEAEDDGPTFVRLLHILANHCALSIKNAQLFRAIDELARRDSLTGLLNHASFLEQLEQMIADAQARQETLTLIMSDLDRFKEFNDHYGHQAGDQVLREVAQWWRAIMPDHCLLGRYGGEEFVAALPNVDLARGEELAEMLREALASHPVSHNAHQLHVTASFGVAELGRPATNATRLIRLADKALYRAKHGGRNRVETHDITRPDIAQMQETSQFALP
jgi:diguanylate cyclase (GGDEF)-like protein